MEENNSEPSIRGGFGENENSSSRTLHEKKNLEIEIMPHMMHMFPKDLGSTKAKAASLTLARRTLSLDNLTLSADSIRRTDGRKRSQERAQAERNDLKRSIGAQVAEMMRWSADILHEGSARNENNLRDKRRRIHVKTFRPAASCPGINNLGTTGPECTPTHKVYANS